MVLFYFVIRVQPKYLLEVLVIALPENARDSGSADMIDAADVTVAIGMNNDF